MKYIDVYIHIEECEYRMGYSSGPFLDFGDDADPQNGLKDAVPWVQIVDPCEPYPWMCTRRMVTSHLITQKNDLPPSKQTNKVFPQKKMLVI